MDIIIWFVILFLFLVWQYFGLGALCAVPEHCAWAAKARGLEFLNPVYIYKHCYVNIFGLCILTIVLNLFCPVVSIGYWLYVLGTVGAKAIEG